MRLLRKLSKLHWLLAALFVVAAFLRLYNLKNTLQFQGDQGRDALIVSRIFTDKDPVFIGPVTSVGNMYLGPLYYYFMLPFLWLSYPSPMGPVYAVAVLGIVTVILMYVLGKKLVGERAAVIATLLFSFSWVVLTYTRFSWNPNPAPFVSLLLMYSTYLAWRKNSWFWVVVCGLYATLLQLHYLTILAGGGFGVIWLIDFWQRVKNKKKRFSSLKQLFIPTIIGALVVGASFTPLVLFDWKHDWLNAKGFQALVFEDENFKVVNDDSSITRMWRSIKETHGRSLHIIFETTVGHVRKLNNVFLITTIATLAHLLKKGSKRKTFYGELVLVVFMVTGIVGTAMYEHTVFDHYIAYLLPATFLLLGTVLATLSKHPVGLVATTGFVIYFFAHNLPKLPLQSLSWTIDDMQTVTKSIYDRVQPGEKYNLVRLSSTKDNDAQNYRYFLHTTNRPPVPTEQRGEVETLFIINEEKVVSNAAEADIYEIDVFPNKQPKEVYSIYGGPEITVLSTRDTHTNAN